MTTDGSITQWIEDIRHGDSIAAAQMWSRYYTRLIHLARKKLGGASRRVADEEDVVVDAFNSFFRSAQAGRFPQLSDRDDLWQVLVMLTARKAANQLKHQHRQKRGGGNVRGESVFLQMSPDEQRATIDQIVGSEPTPEFADDIASQCSELLGQLADATLCKVALAKLEGYSNKEIAEQLGVKTRTVERKLKLIREIWSASQP